MSPFRVKTIPLSEEEKDLIKDGAKLLPGHRQYATFFSDFARAVLPNMELPLFHYNYFRLLEMFARKEIRRLIVTIPPQHGKSTGASVLLPAYILGIDPARHVTIASYSASLASRFNRHVQRVIDSPEYAYSFPDTTIKRPGRTKSEGSSYIRTADHVEIIGHEGELFSTGRGGPMTGNRVDTLILDDLYKNAKEANSPTIRGDCWDWYTSVVRTRMHNDSSELIVFTRWHEEDLIGMISAHEEVVRLTSWAQLADHPADVWLHLNLEALKDSAPTEIDPRAMGESLWPERHSRPLLLKKRALDAVQFESMYQGRPSAPQGLLYGTGFRLYEALPSNIIRRANYTDTADMGEDYLCSACYVVDTRGALYVTDVVYSPDPMEMTEGLVAEMIARNDVRQVIIESNNGGRGFARAVQRLAPDARVDWFHQSDNKEARILSNSATVLGTLHMPRDWAQRWPLFYHHLTTYRRLFRANRWHDAPDVLTGIVEKELADLSRKKLKAVSFKG